VRRAVDRALDGGVLYPHGGRFVWSRAVRTAADADRVVLFDGRADRVFQLAGSEARVWAELASPVTYGALVERLRGWADELDEATTRPERLVADVRLLLRQWIEAGLIRVV